MGEMHGEMHIDEPARDQAAEDRQAAIRRRVWSTPFVILATTSATEAKPTTYVDTGLSGS